VTVVERESDGWWLELEETIAFHPEEIFAALTTVGGLTRWFPVSAEVDLRQGGTIVFGWDENMKRRSTVAILDYDAGGRITWDWLPDTGNTHAPVYWRVEPSVEKGSVVTMRQGPFASDVESMAVMADEAATWRWWMCNMRTVYESRHDMRKVRPL